jgi:hypothetical protein
MTTQRRLERSNRLDRPSSSWTSSLTEDRHGREGGGGLRLHVGRADGVMRMRCGEAGGDRSGPLRRGPGQAPAPLGAEREFNGGVQAPMVRLAAFALRVRRRFCAGLIKTGTRTVAVGILPVDI